MPDRAAGALRELVHRCLWAPLLWLCAGRLRVAGRAPRRPVVFVADHVSHADTVAIRVAVGARVRRRLAVAAADDYFFSTPGRAVAVRTAVGAFPFPRHGDAGLRRADALLARGRSVLLFPQGTRDPEAPYRAGVLRLVDRGWKVVPVGIAGTAHILPKGARWPRRHRIAVTFGPPLGRAEVHHDLDAIRAAVATQTSRAAALLGGNRATSHATGRLAGSSSWLRRRADAPGAMIGMFAWAFAEALVWPIIPDASLGILAAAQPRRWAALAACATAGSVLGGAVGWLAAAGGHAWPLPLTTPRMHGAAAAWLAEGAQGLAHQPLSGVPYKVFVIAAPDAGIALDDLVVATAMYRGLRLGATALLAAALGTALWRWLPPRLQPPVHVALTVGAVVVLVAGLATVVRAWS